MKNNETNNIKILNNKNIMENKTRSKIKMYVSNKIRNNKIICNEKNEESSKTQNSKCNLNKPPSNKTKNIVQNRFDKLYLDSKDREKKHLHLNTQKEKEKLKECTFEPTTNIKRRSLRSQTPRSFIKEDKNTLSEVDNNKRYISNSPKKRLVNNSDKSIKLSIGNIDSINNEINKIQCDINKINQRDLTENSIESTPKS
jgi:hypothetical protein